MKNIFYAIVCFSMWACVESEIPSANCSFEIEHENSVYALDSLGFYHNEVLNHAIESFDTNNVVYGHKDAFLTSFGVEFERTLGDYQISGISISDVDMVDHLSSGPLIDVIFEDMPVVFEHIHSTLTNLEINHSITQEEKTLIEDVFDALQNGVFNYAYFQSRWCSVDKNAMKGLISGGVISVAHHSSVFWNAFDSSEISGSNLRAAPFLVAAADTAGFLEAAASYVAVNSVTGFDDLQSEVLEAGVSLVVGAALSSAAGWYRAVKIAKRIWDWY